MNRNQWTLIAVAVAAALGAGVLIGRVTRSDAPGTVAEGATTAPRKPLYYRNPMGLPDTSPVPKKDSMGMDYIPVYAEDEAASSPGTVVLSPDKVQALGVRTEQVRLRPMQRGVEASGTITVDETRQYVIAPRFDGWVERLHANQTGMRVRRGEPLLTVYSPQLMAAQEEYRIADAAMRSLRAGDPAGAQRMGSLRDAARERLLNWDISEAQLEHIAHKPAGNMVLSAPANAVVIDKPIVQGARFAAGETILRLADLSTVWAVANVPASLAGDVRVGQSATFTSPTLPDRTFSGRVSFIQPVIDPATRSLGVRVALPNPQEHLRPGLFGSIALLGEGGVPVLTMPRSALIDSGTRKIALVQVAEGRFAPRDVVIGRVSGGSVEVLEGLAEGERVVVSANFLIDAESNLQSALQAMGSSSGEVDEPAMPHPPTTDEPAMPSRGAEHKHAPAAQPAMDPHANHRAPGAEQPDPHAGHRMPAAEAPDPHAGHDMSGMEH